MLWSRIFARMLVTLRGMWHSTQELPSLAAGWKVWAVRSFPIAS